MTSIATMDAVKEPRMPVAAVASIAIHALLFLLFLYTAKKAADGPTHVISDVDLIIKVKEQATPPSAEQRVKATTMDFLKLALPSIPKVQAPKMMDVAVPQDRKPIMPEIPNKIEDRGRLQEVPKLAGVDLGSRALDMAKVDAKIPTRRAAAIAEAPKLVEEVGRRRIAMPAAMPLEDAGRAGAGLQAIRGPVIPETRRPTSGAMAPALQEAQPTIKPGGLSGKLAAFLPEARPLGMQPQSAPMPSALKTPVVEKAPPRKAEAIFQEKKKSVEIEGPIADRKVAAYEIPTFPQWAREQGVIEAEVKIRFWVSREGDVLPDLRIEHTSGYLRLDRHAMEALKKWKFAPIFTEEKQWGVITFKFLLE